MLNLNLGFPRVVSDPQVMRNGIRLARCEAYVMNCLFDKNPLARQSIFPTDPRKGFVVVAHDNYYHRVNTPIGL
ncbi:MAG: hypothetical protein IKO40_01510, partial [Kiritimatiellae bacterium]|nr:hypothetical protein [Kiritimatiellia bacterium]